MKRLETQAKRLRDSADYSAPVDREPLYFSRAAVDLRSYETGGLLSATTPKTTRRRADAVKVAEEFTVTAETASPQVEVRKDRSWVCTRSSPDPGNEPCTSSPLWKKNI